MANLVVWRTAGAEWLTGYRLATMSAAPSVAFALMSGALLLRLVFAGTRWTQITVWVVAALVAAAGLHLFIRWTAGQPLPWEAWLNSVFRFNGNDHTSRDAAVLLIVSALNLWALTLGESRLPWVKETAVVATGIVALLGLLCALASTAGNPIFTRPDLLTISPVMALHLCLFNAALLLSVSNMGRLRRLLFGVYDVEDLPPLIRNDRMAFGVVALTSLLVLGGTIVYLRIQTASYLRRVDSELQLAANLRAGDLALWHRERMGDARALAGMPTLGPILGNFSSGRASPQQRDTFSRWLKSYARAYNYRGVLLLDATMTPVLVGSVGPPQPAAFLRDKLLSVPANVDALELPPYVDENGTLRIDFAGLVRRAPGTPPIGAVLLQSDPTPIMLPLLSAWPYGKKTARIGLFLRQGNRLTLLCGYNSAAPANDPAIRPFGQTRDLSDPTLLIARAAAGETALLEGVDISGIPVVGMGRLIPGTDWLLAGVVDSGEIYAPLRRSAWQIMGMTMVVFTGVGFFLTRRLRHRQLDLLRERVVAELAQKRTAARLGAVMGHARDVMLILDAEFRIIEVNQCAVDTYGWSAGELCRMHVRELRSAASQADYERVVTRVREQAGDTFETEHRRKDGTTFPVEASTSQVEIDGRPHYFTIIRDITERRRAEEALHATEERYRLIAENTSDIIWLADLRSGVFTYVSPSIEPTLGWRPADAIGRQIGDFVRAADGLRARIEARVAAFNAGDMTQRHQRYELEMRHRDGSFSPAENSSTILPDADGRAALLLSVNRDISERRRAEVALRESEERYRLIAENTSDVIWLYDLAADGFSYVSPSVFTLRGYRPDELLGKKLTNALPEEAAKRITAGLEKELASAPAKGRRSFNLEIEQNHKDGHLVPTEVVASLLRDASGRPTHLLGITRDITERKRAREALEKFNSELEERVEQRTAELAERNREIQALVESIPDTVLLCDERGELVASQSPQNRLPGFPFADDGASPDRSGYHPTVMAIAREIHAVAWARQQTAVLEFDRTIGGKEISLEARATPAGANRLLILLRDISARKRLERGVLANLERERQLSEMKSQFISVASHEFRTPLAAAVGSLELLERHAARLTEAKRVELLTRIQRSLGRLTSIMNDVLQLSRADSGRVQVKRMDVDLSRFVQDIVHEVQAGDGEQHRFAFHRTGGPDVVPVDTSLVNHILSNLVGNAVRYSPAGTAVTIELEIAAEAFTLRVADEGIGIPEADRDRVFEPFARGSNVGQINGTGLGLNIVKRYTELMGGRIELLPTTSGATFQVVVPCHPPST